MKFIVFLLSIFMLSSCNINDLASVDIAPTIKEPLSASKNLKLTSNNLVWSIEPSENFTDEYYVFDKTAPSQLKGVFSADLFLLTPDDYAIYQEKTKNHECPASFFNSNAVIMSVISEKASLLDKLKKLKTGDKVLLSGKDLNYSVETPDGTPVDFSVDSKLQTVYLENVQVN